MDSAIKDQNKNDNSHVKHRLYRWHIQIGLIISIVFILWTLSGLMRLFTEREPSPGKALVKKPALLSEKFPKLSLQEVMGQNELRSLRNFHLVEMDGKHYYQIRDSYNRLRYFDANTGKPLSDGDQRYAEYLARYFVKDQQASVSTSLQKGFSRQYPESNRLLPVYKVSFGRPDAIDVYVETEHSRLSAFHSLADKVFFWTFFEDIRFSALRIMLPIILFVVLILFAFSGWWLFGLWWQHDRHVKRLGDKNSLLYKYQRQIGLASSFLVFAFACHVAFYVFRKPVPDQTLRFVKNSIFTLEDLPFDTRKLPWKNINAYSASIVNMPQGNFYQLFGKDAEGKEHTSYFNAENGEELEEGDLIYARYLANKFKAHKANIDAGVSFSCCLPPDTIPDGTQLEEAGIEATTLITHFDETYDLSYRRLPVVKVGYVSPATNYFIETGSSRLAGIVDKMDRTDDRFLGTLYNFHFPGKLADKRIWHTLFGFFVLSILLLSTLGFAVYMKLE